MVRLHGHVPLPRIGMLAIHTRDCAVSRRAFTSEQASFICKGPLAKCSRVAWDDVPREGASVHRVHPRGGKRLETDDDRSDGAFVGEDADLAVVGAHLCAEILIDGLRLLAGLDETSQGNTLRVVSSKIIIESQW